MKARLGDSREPRTKKIETNATNYSAYEMNRNKASVIPVKAIQNAPDVRCTDQEKLAATYSKPIIEERCSI